MTMTNWEHYLNQKFCQANPMTGNRPCDDGAPCGKCNSEAAQYDFLHWKVKHLNDRLKNKAKGGN